MFATLSYCDVIVQTIMSKGDGDDWKGRLGIELPEYLELSDSDSEEESKHDRRRRSGGSDEVAETETETFESLDSFSQEEEELARYMKDFSELGRTPPRTYRLRRQKERDAYCLQAKEAAKTIKATLKRRNTSERFLSLPGLSEETIRESSPERTRQQYKEQKRSKDRQRSQDREWKLKQIEPSTITQLLSTLGVSGELDDRSESLPPLSPAVKVDSKSRYMSVSCRKLSEDDGYELSQSSRKISTAELPQDRVSYFHQLQSMVKSGTQEVIHQRQRSEEEVLYHQELHEMLWLELQAWHANLDSNMYDVHLIAQRQEVYDIIQEVLNFKFDPNYSEKNQEHVEAAASEVKISTLDAAVNTGDLKIAGVSVSASDNTDGVGMSTMVGGEEECSGCLSIWCKVCQDRQTEGLSQVAKILKKLDYVESLFPSTKKLEFHYPEWEQPEFVGRYKALCVWYNATVQLRMKIEVLGKLLGNMTSALIPWPTFSTSVGESTTPTSSYDSGAPLPAPSEEISPEIEIVQPKTVSVRFYVESDACSNPSDSNNSTDSGHTTASTNSGLLMPPGHSSVPPPGGLRRCLSDIFIEANPYRKYVEKLLRNKGMKKTFDKVNEVIRDVMYRCTCILEESHHGKNTDGMSKKNSGDLFSCALAESLQELYRYGPWGPKFLAMDLPPFYSMYIFLASVSLQMMRECLKLRLEQMPEKPSRLSIKELMREYKEGVKFAVVVRQKYLRACKALFFNLSKPLKENLELRQNQQIEELDANIKRMLEVYLEWLDQFVCMLHREPHASVLQRNFLQEEWRFVQATCPHVTEGDSLAATRFCNIACHMLCSVGDFIDTGIDDQMAAMQDSTIENFDDSSDEEEMEQDDIQKKRLLQRCRALQVLLGETRERSLRAASLAKMLRKDLEVAAEFDARESQSVVLDRLQATGHIRVIAPHSHNHFIFVPGRIKNKREYIWHLLDMRVGGIGLEHEADEEGGYLVLMRCDSNSLSGLWSGDIIKIEPTADCTITLSRVQVSSLMIVVPSGTMLSPVRREFLRSMGSAVVLVRDQTAPNKAVTHSIDELKKEALELCRSLLKNLDQVENMTDLEQVTPDVDDIERRQLRLVTRDVVHQYYMFGFEYHKEVTRLVTGHYRTSVAPLLVSLARKWMKFIQTHYASGKGERPRWANAGLEFIVFTCDPNNTVHLTDEDFKKFVEEIEDCRLYIIGSAPETPQPTTPLTPVLPRHFRSSSASSLSQLPPDKSLYQSPATGENSPAVNPTDSPLLIRRNVLRRSCHSMEKANDPNDGSSPSTTAEKPIERIQRKITILDQRIETSLREDKVIGRVSATQRDKITFKPRNVSFSWQRGFKIGAGRFGKVYTAVNNNTGELMAMKVLPLQPNDHRSIRRVADELRIFEGIRHSHLVQCYGVEIHNDEMLMFMEYCDEGTLESLAISTETGIPEELVRKYTRQLLEAVNALHERNIVHRDIKGANIFLTAEGNILKLGDFGCAVRLRGHQTEVGELAGIVGTHAYMAPEIFQSSEGHGRAADVWSLGCVVIEMATGKRPWPEYDSSVQIMFRVGMGQSPTIPKSLSDEGHTFLQLCFIHDPKLRATTSHLLDHTFVKVDTGEDCTSLPLFSNSPFVPYMKLSTA